MHNFTALQLSGEFPWPPLPVGAGKAMGTVSIVYYEDATPPGFRACVQWVPKGSPGPAPPSDSLPTFSDPTSAASPFSVWLDKLENYTLFFFKGWFYEQSSTSKDSSTGDLKLKVAARMALGVDSKSMTLPTLSISSASVVVVFAPSQGFRQEACLLLAHVCAFKFASKRATPWKT